MRSAESGAGSAVTNGYAAGRGRRATFLRVHDPYQLPPDLPVPLDDGAAVTFLGLGLPSIQFDLTTGNRLDLRDAGAETLVLYIYPRTGNPASSCPPGGTAFLVRVAVRRSPVAFATSTES